MSKAVGDDHYTSAILHLIQRQQKREQMRASGGIADEHAIDRRVCECFDSLWDGRGVKDDTGDARFTKSVTNYGPVYSVVVAYENTR